MRVILFAALLLVAGVTTGQSSKTLEQLHTEDKIRRLQESIERAEVELNAITKRREIDCAKAVGIAPFCECLTRDLPVVWSFADYVAITTRTKDQNGFDKMENDMRAAYNLVAPIRDKCVRAANAKRE